MNAMGMTDESTLQYTAGNLLTKSVRNEFGRGYIILLKRTLQKAAGKTYSFQDLLPSLDHAASFTDEVPVSLL
jgi:hypothetical protein